MIYWLSLTIIKRKTKYTFHAVAMFYIPKKETAYKIAYFSKIYYHTEVQEPILGGASTSQVRTATMLLLCA
jgi:hypothetical protein